MTVAHNQNELSQTASEPQKQYGIRVDVLVNDAGQDQYGTFDTTDVNHELGIIPLNTET